ncbi:transglutaminase domain-containing protein [Spongiibacter sp. KMU-158]|uniref:Transglutaminase domain-containing protein n=1 Tax=Spongiibacter pelagi TaxID=2760804 RepID=A0A927GVT8_9GAMM|nr:transglutaminase domain-containing protein [Spongiibacter pelagi]MBD2858242.1 transglutaminase domain-containing protein [Spongiibacter pelagi]
MTVAISFSACASRPVVSPADFEVDNNKIIRQDWQSVFLGGNKVGYRQLTQWRQNKDILSRESVHLTFEQPGAPLRQSITTLDAREAENGEPRSITKRLLGDSTNQTLRAWREAGSWWLESDLHPGQRQKFVIPNDFLMRVGVQRVLSSQQGDVRELNYHDWSFSAQRFQAMRLSLKRVEPQALAEILRSRPELVVDAKKIFWLGERRNLDTAGAGSTLVLLDQTFHPLHEISPTGGDEMVLLGSTEQDATGWFSPSTHVYRQLIRSPYRISDSALKGKIRYQLSGEFNVSPPSTFEQKADQTETGWTITVCEDCGDEPAPTDAELSAALTANYWLPLNHPEIKAVIAETLPERQLSAESVMWRLTHFVERRITTPSYAGYGTALEGLRSGEGDCTEHALLLAALGRAAGVPTRVVFGVAYNNERFLGRRFLFVPHAWVQAWTGEHWQSFDSGLGEFNAGYIALGLSDGRQEDVLRINAELHKISIDSAVQLKSRQ